MRGNSSRTPDVRVYRENVDQTNLNGSRQRTSDSWIKCGYQAKLIELFTAAETYTELQARR
jgi:hypothetical protein